MGGDYSSSTWKTTELVKVDGLVENGFILNDYTYIACAIPDPVNEEIILTGGSYENYTASAAVSVYSKAGHRRYLANMNTGRVFHACTSFIFQDTNVLIVIGGADADFNYLETTEIYKDNLWRTVYGKLPAISGLKATTVNNRPLVFVKIYHA